MNESGKQCMLRCIPDEIDLFYFKTCIITHNNNVIEQNINVSMFDILSVKESHIVGAGSIKTWYKVALFKRQYGAYLKFIRMGGMRFRNNLQICQFCFLVCHILFFVQVKQTTSKF